MCYAPPPIIRLLYYNVHSGSSRELGAQDEFRHPFSTPPLITFVALFKPMLNSLKIFLVIIRND